MIWVTCQLLEEFMIFFYHITHLKYYLFNILVKDFDNWKLKIFFLQTMLNYVECAKCYLVTPIQWIEWEKIERIKFNKKMFDIIW